MGAVLEGQLHDPVLEGLLEAVARLHKVVGVLRALSSPFSLCDEGWAMKRAVIRVLLRLGKYECI